MPSPLDRRRFLQVIGAALAGAGCASGPDRADRADDDAGVPSPSRRTYGDHDAAFGDLWLPAEADGPVPVVVLIHGGFWRASFGLDLMDGLAASVAAAGWAAWNIEYRRVGSGGGYPETFDDVAAAIDHLATADLPIDPDRVAVVGHSAGGQLAVWAASRASLDPGTDWSEPLVRPRLAVSQAGVLDLVECAESGLGGGACPDLLGGTPADVPERYDRASPVALVPADAPVFALHGTADRNVPIAQTERYVAAAGAAGGQVRSQVFDGADHFDVIDPDHESWQVVLEELSAALDR